MSNPRLAKIIRPPCEYALLVIDRKRVVVTTGNVLDILSRACRDEAKVLVALDDAASELVLLAAAPREDGAFVVEGKDMVRAASDLGDVFDAGDVRRGALN